MIKNLQSLEEFMIEREDRDIAKKNYLIMNPPDCGCKYFRIENDFIWAPCLYHFALKLGAKPCKIG